jgi:cytochrome c peroxidase
MHNGQLETLSDVVEFYNSGGGSNEFAANKTPLVEPLGLNEREIEDLVAFLDSMSGEEILMDEPDLPDYAPMP